MTNQAIPDAAVEAACAAWFARRSRLTPGDTKAAMRGAIEAAAPHMTAPPLDPELALEVATENYRQWLDEQEAP